MKRTIWGSLLGLSLLATSGLGCGAPLDVVRTEPQLRETAPSATANTERHVADAPADPLRASERPARQTANSGSGRAAAGFTRRPAILLRPGDVLRRTPRGVVLKPKKDR